MKRFSSAPISPKQTTGTRAAPLSIATLMKPVARNPFGSSRIARQARVSAPQEPKFDKHLSSDDL